MTRLAWIYGAGLAAFFLTLAVLSTRGTIGHSTAVVAFPTLLAVALALAGLAFAVADPRAKDEPAAKAITVFLLVVTATFGVAATIIGAGSTEALRAAALPVVIAPNVAYGAISLAGLIF